MAKSGLVFYHRLTDISLSLPSFLRVGTVQCSLFREPLLSYGDEPGQDDLVRISRHRIVDHVRQGVVVHKSPTSPQLSTDLLYDRNKTDHNRPGLSSDRGPRRLLTKGSDGPNSDTQRMSRDANSRRCSLSPRKRAMAIRSSSKYL